jgi:DNA-binding MarR family transcriptional regulator
MAQDARTANPPVGGADDVVLERALEGLFRLTANRRFDARQTAAVGASVTRAGYALLRNLADSDVLSLRELSAASHMDTAAASRQINQLVDEGLVHRRTAADARAVELSLTRRGRQIYERIVAYRLAHLANALDGWTDRDRRVLATLVVRLAEDLGGTDPPAAPAPTT